jgi:AcrR family transcriptional regulator
MSVQDASNGGLDEEELGEGLGDHAGEGRVHQLLVRELGEDLANAFARTRRAQEAWAREHHPERGLRERKKRLTRQRISDVATTLFVVRGFENVTVSEVAEVVGVSEKTVFNYFPTKESMVFDEADEGIARLAAALREREPGESLTRAVVRELAADLERHGGMADELTHFFLPSFAEMIATTPSLRAAWLDIEGRLVEVAMEELAAGAEVDSRDPEPLIAARALVGLVDVSLQSRVRRTEEGLTGPEWRRAVLADVERAGRLLETGLWSFELLTQGARTRKQLQEAARAAEQAREQVLDALGQARAAWRELRGQAPAEDRRAARAGAERTRAARRRGAREQADQIKAAARAHAEQIKAESKAAARAQAEQIKVESKRAARAMTAQIKAESKAAARAKVEQVKAELKAGRT